MEDPFVHIDISWRQQGLKSRAVFDLSNGVTALIGPSGAGKTRLARMIAGLDTPTAGTIRFKENILFNSKKGRNICAADRNIGLVMQQSALFPHLSVEQNLRFSPSSTDESITDAVHLLDLSSLLHRDTTTLSGGETKRVAIARALAAKPALLILDEPMNGLDPKARGTILPMIKKLGQTAGVPTLMITHQIEDMLRVADDAVLMRPREVVAFGSLESILAAPECTSLMGVSDAGQLLTGTITGRENSLLLANLGGDTIFLPDTNENTGEEVGASATLRVFASDISIAKTHIDDISILNQLEANITDIKASGNQATLTLELVNSGVTINSSLTAQSVARLALKAGDRVFALIKAVSVKDIGH